MFKKIFNRRFFLAIALPLIVFALIWYYLWFKVSDSLKTSLSEYKKQSSVISYSNVEISGFPFNIDINFKNPTYTLDSTKFSAENLHIKTNFIFNELLINFPEELNTILTFKNQNHNLIFKTKDDSFLLIKEANSFNSLNVILAVLNDQKITEFLNVQKIELHLNNILVSNFATKTDLSNENIDLSINFTSESNTITKSEVELNLAEQSLNINEHILHPFEKVNLDTKFEIMTRNGRNMFFIDYANVDLFELLVDESKLSLKGNLDKDKKEDTHFKFFLTCNKFIDLVNKLLDTNYISKEKYDVLITMIKDISGSPNPEESFKISLYTHETQGIKLGNTSLYRILKYVNKFISTP